MRRSVVAGSLAILVLAGCDSAGKAVAPPPPSTTAPPSNDPAADAEVEAALEQLEQAATGHAVERITISTLGIGDVVQISEIDYDATRLRLGLETHFEGPPAAARTLISPEIPNIDHTIIRFFKDDDQVYVTADNDVYAGRWVRLDIDDPGAANDVVEIDVAEPLPRLVALLRFRTASVESNTSPIRVDYAVHIPNELGLFLLGSAFLDKVTEAGGNLAVDGYFTATVSVSSAGILEEIRYDVDPILRELSSQLIDPAILEHLERTSMTAQIWIDHVGSTKSPKPPPADKIVDSLE